MLSCLNSGCTFPECNPPPFCEPSWAPPTEATCPPSTSRWTRFLSFFYYYLFNLYTFLLNSNWMSITLPSATTSAIAFSPWWKKLPIFSLVLHNKRYAYCFTLFFLENLLNLYLVSLVPWPFMLSCWGCFFFYCFQEELLCLCSDLETHVKCHIRESEKCLYRTRVSNNGDRNLPHNLIRHLFFSFVLWFFLHCKSEPCSATNDIKHTHAHKMVILRFALQ